MQLQISESKLKEKTIAAINYLNQECDMSDEEIGKHVGYPDGQMISKIRRGITMPSAVRLVNLARFASHHGYDELADLFSAPAKHAIPSTAGEAEPNLCLLEENQAITVSLGKAIAAFNEGDMQTAQAAFRQSMAAHFDALKEVHAFAALRASRGDGSITIMPNARVATI